MSPTNMEITVIRCKGVAKVQLVGKQDPYVVLNYADQELRSKTCHDGGQDPNFNELFTLFLKGGAEPKVDIGIFVDRPVQKGTVVGRTRVSFAEALQKGSAHGVYPVLNAKGDEQGTIELGFRCLEVMAALQAATQLETLKVAGAQERYNVALAEARGRLFPTIPAILAPHEVVSKTTAKEHLEGLYALQGEEEKEMGKIFQEAKQKAKELTELLANESSSSTAVVLSSFPKAIGEKDPDANAKFHSQIGRFLARVGDDDKARGSELRDAEALLIGGFEELQQRYRAAVKRANHHYDSRFNKAVLQYQQEVEDKLKREAEGRAQEEAAAVAPPPGK